MGGPYRQRIWPLQPPPPSGHGDILNCGGSSLSRGEKVYGGKKRDRPTGVTTTHGVKFQHLKKISSSTRRSTSPINFNPAPATCTPKRPHSTSLKEKHATQVPSISVSRAAAATSARPSSSSLPPSCPQVPVLSSNVQLPLATLPKPKKTNHVVPCTGISHGAFGSALSFSGRVMLYTAYHLMA